MPLYEYRCQQCGETFEQLVPAGKRNRPGACPKCGSERVSKLLSLFGRLFGRGGDAGCRQPT